MENQKEWQKVINASAPIHPDKLHQTIYELHHLNIEWYETNRSLIRRKTDLGLSVQVKKKSTEVYDEGDVIFDRDDIRVKVRIKPCDTIILKPRNLNETGRICFEIGNQHIPIFLSDSQEIMAAYDANLYNLLRSGNFEMFIKPKVLSPKQMVKAYGNFF
jgi:urease accessory protein